MVNQSDFMSGAEIKALLGSKDKTGKFLYRYRKAYWLKGIHYVAPVQRVLYLRPMIMDWIFNHDTNPLAHQDAMEAWVAKTQGRKPRR